MQATKPHSQVDKSEKSDCLVRFARFTSTICSLGARPPVLSPDACASVADDHTSNKLQDFRGSPPRLRRHPAGSVLSRSCFQSGNFLLRCNESRMVGLAVLILLLGGHQLLQNANDSRRSVVRTPGTARQERKQRGTIVIGNHVHGAFEPTATSTASNTFGYLQRGSWLLLPFISACFSPPLTFRADVATIMRVMVSPVVHPRLS